MRHWLAVVWISRSVTLLAFAASLAGVAKLASAQEANAQEATAPKRLPYAAVHDPEFIKASDATFMSADDRIIGLMSGNVPKAFPAGILSQHGLVEDQSPKGPIAITW